MSETLQAKPLGRSFNFLFWVFIQSLGLSSVLFLRSLFRCRCLRFLRVPAATPGKPWFPVSRTAPASLAAGLPTPAFGSATAQRQKTHDCGAIVGFLGELVAVTVVYSKPSDLPPARVRTKVA